jgi:metal-responsive CopG/Arc/MetJ family transcriptional regulator
MAEEKYEVWVHVKITEKELAEQLDAMVESDQLDRSKMVRRLIRQEWNRRNGQAHWMGSVAEPLSIVTVAS